MKIVPGQNVTLSDAAPRISISMPPKGYVLHAFSLGVGGRATSPHDVAFYGRPEINGLSLHNQGAFGALLRLNPSGLPEVMDRMLICLSAWSGFIAAAAEDAITIQDGESRFTADIPFTGNYERSLVLGEIYRRNGQIRFRVKMDGYKHGLEAVNESYGLHLETVPPALLATPGS